MSDTSLLRNVLYVKVNYSSPPSMEVMEHIYPVLQQHPEIEVYDIATRERPIWLPLVPVFFNRHGIPCVGPDAIISEFKTIQLMSAPAVPHAAPPSAVVTAPSSAPGPTPGSAATDEGEESDPDDDSWTKPTTVGKDSSNDDTMRRMEEMERKRAERESKLGGKKR